MEPHRVDATVSGDGSVTVRGVPFPEGTEVEVIVRPRQDQPDRSPDAMPLAGSVRRYEHPFEPATSADEWETV